MDLSPTNIARLEHVLRTLDFTQGADAEIRADGYLWICPKPGRKVETLGQDTRPGASGGGDLAGAVPSTRGVTTVIGTLEAYRVSVHPSAPLVDM